MVIASVAGRIATKRGACLGRGPKGMLVLVIGRDWQVYAIGLCVRIEVSRSVTSLYQPASLCLYNDVGSAINTDKRLIAKYSR